MYNQAKYLLLFLLVFSHSIFKSQTFLNGSFEINTAVNNQINLSNAGFNGFMSNTFAFGTTGNMDIIRTNTWGGGFAQHCTWYVALTGSGTDIFSMTLSAPLVTGTTYTISFWDRKDAGFAAFPVQIGLSTVNNAAGTVIYTAPVAPTNNVWTQRTFTFVAPNNGQFITVRQNGGSTSSWAHVDNFVLNNTSSAGNLNITPSATTICVGSSAIFTVTGASTYTWNPAATLSSPSASVVTATPPSTTTYSVTGSAGGCLLTGSITLNVIPPPAVTITPATGTLCPGQSLTLTALGATTYSWKPSTGLNTTTGSVVIATPTANTTYTVIGGSGSCTSSAVSNITVSSPLPLTVIASPPSICSGASSTLSASGANSYTWSPSTGLSSANGASVTATPLATTIYTVVGTNSLGCVASNTTNLVVNPTPSITVNSPTTCVNSTFTLTSSGGSTYSWSGPLSFSSNLQNPVITNASSGMTGVYTVTVTSAAGCFSVANTNVQILPLPNPQITSNSPVCAGNTINLNGNGGTTYAWSGPNGFTSTLQNPTVGNATSVNAGVYTLLVASGNCTASTTATVTVNPLPTPQIVSNSPVCVGQSINFTGSGGTSYAWAGPGFLSTAQNPSIATSAVSNSGTYTLAVIDANNCTNSVTANVIVNPLPSVNATGSSACENNNATLSATGGVSYSWSGPGGFTSTNQNVTINNVQFSASGQYTVLVTDANTCTNTAVANVTVNPAPVASISVNGPICENSILSLSGNGGVSYNWSGPNGFTSSVQSPTLLANSVAYSGNYNLTITDANGCTASAVATATVNPIPSANITSSANSGCAPLCVNFKVNASSNVVSYNWNLGNGSTGNSAAQQTCYGATGIYTINVSVSDGIGCSNSSTYTVNVFPQPIADFNHAPIKPVINVDPEVTFTDASHGANVVAWNWYFMNTAQYTSTTQNPTFMYTEPGTYAVALVVKSDKGCTDTIVRSLVVGEDYGIYVPNAFTPNNDGLNDIFQPKGFGIVKYELQIFDRWGERIFSTKTFEEGWNGKIQSRGGDVVQEGVYTWLINTTSVFGKSHEIKGHVTLIK